MTVAQTDAKLLRSDLQEPITYQGHSTQERRTIVTITSELAIILQLKESVFTIEVLPNLAIMAIIVITIGLPGNH